MGDAVGTDREPLVIPVLEVVCRRTRFVRADRGNRYRDGPLPAIAGGAAGEQHAAPGGVAARVVPASPDQAAIRIGSGDRHELIGPKAPSRWMDPYGRGASPVHRVEASRVNAELASA